MSSPVEPSSLNQADYMKLFMQELSYQDPLKPVDNREFMAQMAQFSQLQATEQTNVLLGEFLGMSSADQCLNLLGKSIKITNSDKLGTVTNVQFFEKEPPKIAVDFGKGAISYVGLLDIKEVEA